jgi:hypothetical protein
MQEADEKEDGWGRRVKGRWGKENEGKEDTRSIFFSSIFLSTISFPSILSVPRLAPGG